MRSIIVRKGLSWLTYLILTAAVLSSVARAENASGVTYRTVAIEDVEIFYREAGSPDKPTLLLLHGFPTSSHMFRDLIPSLADDFHLVAPDYPGFGNSAQPPLEDFEYTFDRLAEVIERFTEALGLDKYSIYLMDYGAPVGFRLAVKHPERVGGWYCRKYSCHSA